MTTSPVCFGASADSFGRFVTPIAGDLLSFKLIHQSGSVECAAGWSSRWGCTFPSVSKDHRLGTIITNSQSVRLLPKDDYFFVEGSPCNNHYYGLPGQAADSPELLFDNFSTPLNVSIGEEFRIWFTEDFYKCGYADNGLGKTCVLVFGLFVQFRSSSYKKKTLFDQGAPRQLSASCVSNLSAIAFEEPNKLRKLKLYMPYYQYDSAVISITNVRIHLYKT